MENAKAIESPVQCFVRNSLIHVRSGRCVPKPIAMTVREWIVAKNAMILPKPMHRVAVGKCAWKLDS